MHTTIIRSMLRMPRRSSSFMLRSWRSLPRGWRNRWGTRAAILSGLIKYRNSKRYVLRIFRESSTSWSSLLLCSRSFTIWRKALLKYSTKLKINNLSRLIKPRSSRSTTRSIRTIESLVTIASVVLHLLIEDRDSESDGDDLEDLENAMEKGDIAFRPVKSEVEVKK